MNAKIKACSCLVTVARVLCSFDIVNGMAMCYLWHPSAALSPLVSSYVMKPELFWSLPFLFLTSLSRLNIRVRLPLLSSSRIYHTGSALREKVHTISGTKHKCIMDEPWNGKWSLTGTVSLYCYFGVNLDIVGTGQRRMALHFASWFRPSLFYLLKLLWWRS